MVKIKELSEEEDMFSDEEAETEQEDSDDDLPDPPGPPDPPLVPIMFPVPELSAPEGAAAGPSAESTMVCLGLSRRYARYLLGQYGHSIELNRSLREGDGLTAEGLCHWAGELQQQPDTPNGEGDPKFACSISAPDTPDRNMEDNRSTEGAANVSASKANISIRDSSTQTTEEVDDKSEDDKTESDESTEEKSDGVAEKVQLAATAADDKAGLPSSPNLSDNELSEVSGSLPPDNDSLQAYQNQDYTGPCGLKECQWTKDIGRDSGMDDADPELNESTPEKEPSEASGEGEAAAALPASAVLKDCWEEVTADDQLFTLPSVAPVASSSTAVSVRDPGPASPTSDCRRSELENRPREHLFAARPMSRIIFVSTEKIGRIIGKGGRRVKRLERSSGASIKVEHKRSAKPVTKITLTGTEEEITKADEEISEIIRNSKPAMSGEPTTASVRSIEELELSRLLVSINKQMLDSKKQCQKPAD